MLDQNIDTGDATGRLLFNMLGAIAQFETEIRATVRPLIKELQKQGYGISAIVQELNQRN